MIQILYIIPLHNYRCIEWSGTVFLYFF